MLGRILPASCISLSQVRRVSSSSSFRGYIGPQGGVSPSLISMAWSKTRCSGTPITFSVNTSYLRNFSGTISSSPVEVTEPHVKASGSFATSSSYVNSSLHAISRVQFLLQSSESNVSWDISFSKNLVGLCLSSHYHGRTTSIPFSQTQDSKSSAVQYRLC